MLDRNLSSRSDKTALYSDARTLSFGEAASEANRVGNALRGLGVRMGDTVALLSLDRAEWVSVFFGTLKIGAISVGINTLLTEKEYAFILDDCRARVLIVHETLWAKIAPILDAASFVKHVILIGGSIDRSVSYHDWIVGEADVLEPARTHREDFCPLNYSSGTTGQPKGILHAHKDLALTAVLSG